MSDFLFLQVYACLLHMYLAPPEASILGAKTRDLQLKPNVDAALNVLQEHYDKINPVKVDIVLL